MTNLFSPDDVPGLGAIDAKAVIRGAKRRRLPMQLATGGALVLALGGIGLTVQGVLGAENQTATLSQPDYVTESSEGGASSFDGQRDAVLSADQLSYCGEQIADVSPSPSGLVLSLDFPNGTGGSTPIEGTVTMTNNGDAAIRGYTAANPVLTLAQGGRVIWHSNGAMIMSAAEIALAPGETYVYTTSFTPVVCGEDDERDAGFRAELPPAPAGEYQLLAAIDLMGDVDELVTGSVDSITLD
ncbi:hypothetical protein EYE40_02115 [Glaciihabitans arcticus]|uniref:Uncharacterized protein n=1 Tax=Glaciihabitans arcticus TaxID=2668039 RepID=A0A4Q9GNK1_9MICO|nr:hypothetical protein [Glaciihabitans arcticus]TBN56286.1 hypothetical protein EYE40_02115 [Glaciihabitans arcticus]